MRNRYQGGCLRCTARKSGPACWEFLWRETTHEGARVRRKAVIGTTEEFPTREAAEKAANGLRMCVNQERNRQPEQRITVTDLIDHYIKTELSDAVTWHSLATKTVYREFLERWIRTQWGATTIREVRTIAVEHWLHDLRRIDGDPLADSTKAKIRNILSVLFNHAIRHEWL